MSEWTTKIKELREVGLTLVEIGQLCGTSASTISDIEQGRTREPRYMLGKKLSKLHHRVMTAEGKGARRPEIRENLRS